VRNKAVHIALGVRADGTKEILGTVARAERRLQILATRHERAEKPPRRRRADRGCQHIRKKRRLKRRFSAVSTAVAMLS
jgi:hypothetical protein